MTGCVYHVTVEWRVGPVTAPDMMRLELVLRAASADDAHGEARRIVGVARAGTATRRLT